MDKCICETKIGPQCHTMDINGSKKKEDATMTYKEIVKKRK